MVMLDTQMDDAEKIGRMSTRKSPRLNSDRNGVPGRSVGPQSPLRRSSRTITLTTRHQSSINGVLKRTDDMKKKGRFSESKKISKSRRSKTLAVNRDLSDEEEHSGERDGDIDKEQVTVDDNDGGAGPSFDPRLNRATSDHYQGLIDEFSRGQSWPCHRGNCCIGGSRLDNGNARPSRFWTTQRKPKHSHEVSSQDEENYDDDDDDNEQREFHNRCQPLNLHREDILGVSHRHRMKGGAGLTDMDPMAIGQSVGFDSVGGLSGHISALKEMVVFPLLYPEVFDNFKIQPPRGCLFYGPPGTGKTLVARALAHESSRGERKVSFFMRKGADCLSKWVGETERQLRLLFEQAYHMRPSIIFFDEIDGLAPVRSSRQDHIHSSIVSTLLALMDGLDDRGGVVVIGATNRLDSVDPALRRPGRFDRELLFSLPDRESRSEILRIHTRQWNPCPSEAFLEELAEKTVGYCGADIRAVCTEAALCALRRRYPQIYDTSQKLLLDVSSIAVRGCDFLAAMRRTVPASQRSTASPAKALAPVVRPLLGPTLRRILESLLRQFPHAEQALRKKRGILDDDLAYRGEECSCDSISKPSTFKSSSYMNCTKDAVHHPMSHRPRMLLAGHPGAGQSSHLAPAVLHALESFTVHMLDVAKLFGVSYTSPEEACAQVFLEAKRTSPSILYLPHIQQWWETSDPVLRTTFISLLQDIPSFCPILLLATSDVPHKQLDAELQVLFRVDYGEVHSVRVPTQQERSEFFEDLVLSQAAKALKKKPLMQEMEVLPVAPPPAQWQLSEQERLRLEEQEEDVLRELRLFLRDITERLRADRRFKAFSKPVDIEEVPNYQRVIEKPMDLSTLQSNIDQHCYATVGGFVADVDLIWQNALQSNAESDPCARLIRHRAYAFKDTVHSIIRHELDEDLEKVCEEVMESRIKRGCTSSSSAQSHYQNHTTSEGLDGRRTNTHHDMPQSESRMKKRHKRPRKTKWSNGIIKKGVKRKMKPPDHPSSSTPNEQIGGTEAERGETPTRVTGPIPENGCHVDSPDESSTPPSGGVNWGGEGEQSTHTPAVNGSHLDLAPWEDPELCEDPEVQNGIHVTAENHPLVNGNNWLEPLNSTRLIPPRRACFRGNGELLSEIEYRTQETHKTLDTLSEMTAPLVVDHGKLRDLHKRVVLKTEGMLVCQLEKLYTLLAQCIYRQRKNYNKTRLIQEMKREIDTFS